MTDAPITTALLAGVGFAIFAGALYVKGGTREIRGNLPWLLLLVAGLVALTILMPALTRLFGPFLPAALVAAGAAAWSAWTARHVRGRSSAALWLLTGMMLALAVASLVVGLWASS